MPQLLFTTADARKPKFQMPRAVTEIRSLARSHTRSALNVLVGVMRHPNATPSARVAAATAILDRGWGRPTQALEGTNDGALELIHRIERVIGLGRYIGENVSGEFHRPRVRRCQSYSRVARPVVAQGVLVDVRK
jgi:hypothetical protein